MKVGCVQTLEFLNLVASYSNAYRRLVATTRRLQEELVGATRRLQDLLKGLVNISSLKMRWD